MKSSTLFTVDYFVGNRLPIVITDYRVPIKGDLYITKLNTLRRCSRMSIAKNAQRKFIVVEQFYEQF